MLFGKLRQCRIFAVVAFRQQFAKIGESFAGVFLVDFVKERGDAAVIKAVSAFFVHAQAYGVKIGAQAGLEEQAVIKVIGKLIVGLVDGVNDVLRFFFAEVVEFWGSGASEGVKNGNSAVLLRLFLFFRIRLADEFPEIHGYDGLQFVNLFWGQANALVFIHSVACPDHAGAKFALQVTFCPLRIGIRPGFEQFVAQRQLLFFGGRVFVLLQCFREFGRLCGSFAQVAQSAAAAQVHFLLLFVAERDAVAIAAVKTVGGKAQIAHDVFIAVLIGVAADFGEGVAVVEVFIRLCVAEVERLDAQVFERKDFTFFADAVVIEVAPDAEFTEGAVGCVHFAVAVVIQLSQGGKAMRSGLAVFKRGVVAKDFAAIADFAIAVAVMHQKAVVAVHPAGGSADAVTLMVKHRACMSVGSKGFDAVAVQVKGEGVGLVEEHLAQ